jgi:hypothetical protein
MGMFAKMESMRLFLLCALPLAMASVCFAESPKAGDAPAATIRGKLVQRENETPALETDGHKLIVLKGDGSTEHVLHDKRLAGLDLEAAGHFTDADHFEVNPFHTRALHVVKDGKRLIVTYWCDVCSIRTYEPGPCWCCQRETKLALREPDPE